MSDVDHVARYEPPPAPGGPTLLLLHGTGGDESDLLPLGRALDPSAGLLGVRGNVRESGMPRWFRRFAEGVFDVDDLVARAGALAAFVERAADAHGFDRARVVAVGFSNGANIAAALLLLHPEVLRGAVLFAPMVPLPRDRLPAGLPDLGGVAVFASAGRADPMAPAPQAEELARLLTDAGAAVELHWHPGGHGIPPSHVDAGRAWLGKLTAAIDAAPERPLP